MFAQHLPGLVDMPARPSALLRLYCIPHGGSGPQAYRGWPEWLPATIELVAVDLPGRAARAGEPSHTDPALLASLIGDVVTDHDDGRPYAFFGHSAGGLLAYETVRRLRQANRRQPVLLALSSFPAPQMYQLGTVFAQLVAQDLTGMFDMLGVPTHQLLRRDPAQLVDVVTPLLADLLLVLQYQHVDEPPLEIPGSVFGADRDPLVPATTLHAWGRQFTRTPAVHLHPGGHLYLQDRAPQVIAELAQDLRTAVDLPV